MTEDADLLAYGCRRVLYKFDRKKKYCDLIERDAVLKDFKGYSQFLDFCVLCGCDFFKYPKISTYRAFQTIRQYDSFFLAQLPRKSVFMEAFYRAKFTFLNQLVYCPVRHKMVSLSVKPLTKYFSWGEKLFFKKFFEDENTKDFLMGEMRDDMTAELIAKCELSPITWEFL